jgi:ribose 5-phosphate isomerase RpiB
VAKACLREFLIAEYQGGRHAPRLAKVARIEAEEAGH